MSEIASAIVGMKHHVGAHDKLIGSPEGTEVVLVREPTNRFDPNAIKCLIDGQMCGYIPAPQAKALAPDMDGGREVSAVLFDYNKLHIEVEDEPVDAA